MLLFHVHTEPGQRGRVLLVEGRAVLLVGFVNVSGFQQRREKHMDLRRRLSFNSVL